MGLLKIPLGRHTMRSVNAGSFKNSVFSTNSDLVFYYENSSFFLDIIGRDETFSEHGFQVSGVRFQAGFRFFPTDT